MVTSVSISPIEAINGSNSGPCQIASLSGLHSIDPVAVAKIESQELSFGREEEMTAENTDIPAENAPIARDTFWIEDYKIGTSTFQKYLELYMKVLGFFILIQGAIIKFALDQNSTDALEDVLAFPRVLLMLSWLRNPATLPPDPGHHRGPGRLTGIPFFTQPRPPHHRPGDGGGPAAPGPPGRVARQAIQFRRWKGLVY